MSERFIDGADLLIVDDVHAAPAPDYALDHVQVAIPPGAEQQASAFWVDVVGLTLTDKPPQLVARGGVWLTGDALNLHLGVDSDFRPATKAHPGILVRDYDALLGRLSAAGYETRTGDEMPGRFTPTIRSAIASSSSHFDTQEETHDHCRTTGRHRRPHHP